MLAGRARFAALVDRLVVPVVAAPMFGVSGPELVIAACKAGVVGAFPTANAPSSAELDDWLTCIRHETAGAAPWAANLIVHRSNPRLASDLAAVCSHRPPIVITSVGSPAAVAGAIHEAGGLLLADVATVAQARKALAAGADGLVLLCAGAGGQTGWANPFAFVRAVRGWFDGPVVVAGGIADGWAVHAATVLGADLAYVGTRVLATTESRASEAWKEHVAAAELDEVVLTTAITGLPTNVLAGSFEEAALRATVDERAPSPEPGRAVRAHVAGHGVSTITDVVPVAKVVLRLADEFAVTRAR